MKITIQTNEYTHSYDSSVDDRIEGGWLNQYHPPVEEAIDAVMELLSCVYSRKAIAEILIAGIPAMDYAKESK